MVAKTEKLSILDMSVVRLNDRMAVVRVGEDSIMLSTTRLTTLADFLSSASALFEAEDYLNDRE